MAVGKFGFWIRGIEPHADPAWMIATDSGRLEFWAVVAKLAAAEWDAQTAAGIGADGRKLIAITAATRYRRSLPGYSPMGRADPSAPPLTPCYGRSRTRSLLRSTAHADGVYFYWADDEHTGMNWGEILDAHRLGIVTGGRKRDVFGLAPDRKASVQAKAWAWWGKNRLRLATRGANERTRATDGGVEIDLGLGDVPPPKGPDRAQQRRARRAEGPRVERVQVTAGIVHVDAMTSVGGAARGPITHDTGFREKRIRGK